MGDYKLDALKAFGVVDNSITSLKVAEGFKIILYAEDNFTGQSLEITADNGFVGNFNDLASSLRVLPNGNKNLAGTYFLKNAASGLFMDVWENKMEDGAAIRQGIFYGYSNQQFELEHLGDGLYKVKAKHSGKYMDVASISKAEGAVIHQWTYYGTTNQNFILVDGGNGSYKIIAEHSGKVVEVSTNNAVEQLHQWWNAGQVNSYWKLEPVTGNTSRTSTH